MTEAVAAGRSGGPSGWVAIGLAVGVASVLMVVALLPGHPGDTSHYLYWTWQATSKGLEWIYAGTYPIDFAIYPPLVFYPWWLTGSLFRLVADPAFGFDSVTTSQSLAFLLKLTPIVAATGIAVVVYWLTSRWGAARWAALVSGAAAALAPGMAYDVAVWGQPDSLHTFFLLLALATLVPPLGGQAMRPAAGGVAYALAALAKPQAWVLGPVFAVLLLRTFGRRALWAVPAAAVTGAVVLLPWLIGGRWRDLLRLPGEVNNAMDAASANAHNLWWVVTGGVQPFVPDSAELVAGLSIRSVSLLLVGAVVLAGCWRAWAGDNPFAVAAWTSFGFFCVVTRAHENHSYAAVVLLAPLLPFRPAARWLFVAASLALFVNILLLDQEPNRVWTSLVGAEVVRSVSLLAAWANLALFAVWTWLLVRGDFAGMTAHGPARSQPADPASVVASPVGG